MRTVDSVESIKAEKGLKCGVQTTNNSFLFNLDIWQAFYKKKAILLYFYHSTYIIN